MKFLFTLLITGFSVISFCQTIELNQLKALKPRNVGPAGMSGRITSIDAVVNDPDTWYVGAASGGVWKTTNAGATWTSIFDGQLT
jgi:hypothetical protein